jgi:putative aldouronate transport system permease protein
MVGGNVMSMKIKQSKGDMVFDFVIHGILVLVLIIATYPLLFVISASISDPMAVLQGDVWLFPKRINFEAYRRVFENKNIVSGYINTILYTVVGTAVNVVMTIAGAYPLSRKDFYGRNIFMLLFTFTMFFSGGLIPTYILMKQIGLYNNFWVMILPGAVGMWNMIIMRTFFQNTIPMELQEAAFIDGCSNVGTLWRIVLPLSKPIIAVMVMFYGVAHWNAFFNALIYLTDRSRYPLQLVLREILIAQDMASMTSEASDTIMKQQMLAEGLKYSVIVVASLPVIALYPFLQKYFIKGVMVGAIKG